MRCVQRAIHSSQCAIKGVAIPVWGPRIRGRAREGLHWETPAVSSSSAEELPAEGPIVTDEGTGGYSDLSMVADGSGLGIGESQDPRTLSWKAAKNTSLVIEPPRPGHAFSQVVRAQGGTGQMQGTFSSMHMGAGTLDPAADSTGVNLIKTPGIPSAGAGTGIMMLSGGRLNTVTSANLQATNSGGVVSPHATSVDSDKSSTIAEVDMLLPQTPSSFQKLERKRAAEVHADTPEQMYPGVPGVMVQAKRARSIDATVGNAAAVNQASVGGYVPSSLQLAAAVVQPTSSPGLLLDSKPVISSSSLQGTNAAGQSQRVAMVPVVSHGELAASQVQFGIAHVPSNGGQAVVTAQNTLQQQGITPRLQPISALEAIRSVGALGHDSNLVGRMTVPTRVPVERAMQHPQVIARHGINHGGSPAFTAGYVPAEDVQHQGPTKRKIQRKRENLPKESTALLKQWLLSHMLLPYPGNEEKMALCRATNLEMAQINNWFINARVRIWKPLVQKVFDQYEPILKKQAEDEKDEQQLKRIRDARKSSTLNMITLLSGFPEARKELDEIASKSKALSKDC